MSSAVQEEWHAEVGVDPRWLAIDAIYGGYVASLAAETASRFRPELVPLSMTVEFLGSIRPGSATVAASLLHSGRHSATAAVTLSQGHVKAVAHAKLLDCADGAHITSVADLSEAPNPELLGHRPTAYGRLPWEDQVELRGLAEPLSPLEPVRGWARILPGRLTPKGEVSGIIGAPLLLDVMPSGLFGVEPLPVNVPTVAFTVHASTRPVVVGEWYFVSQQLAAAGTTFAIEDGTLHDSDGVFIASARQTRRVIRA